MLGKWKSANLVRILKKKGANVKKALDLLGFGNVKKVDSVKCYRIIIDKNESDAMKEADEICKKLLANPVVHEYSISVAK